MCCGALFTVLVKNVVAFEVAGCPKMPNSERHLIRQFVAGWVIAMRGLYDLPLCIADCDVEHGAVM